MIAELQKLIRDILQAKAKLIFISHPYSDNPAENKKKVDIICKELAEEGYIPLSPLHLFSCLPDDRHRKIIMLICKLLIIMATKCHFYSYGNLSGGQAEEMGFAYKVGKPVEVFET